MTRSNLPLAAIAVFLGAALAAMPAFAQRASQPSLPYNPATSGHYGYQPPAGTPVTPHGQGGFGAIPPIEQQNRAAAAVQGSSAGQGVEPLLHQADAALQRRNFGVANELLERAQTVAMNTAAAGGGSPGSLTSAIGEARRAVVDGHVPAARERIGTVLHTLQLGAAAMAAPPGTGAPAVSR